jgi:predicted phage terminase large subunit-like protein
MAAQKIAVGPYAWTSLYQGRPTPAKGEIIKKTWWKFYGFDPKSSVNSFQEIVQSWDLTFKDTKDSARVSGQVWGRIDANCYLLDEVTELMDFPATIKAIRTMTGKWPQALKKYVEDKANGPAVISVLKNKIPGLIPVEPEGGKVARAYAITGILEAGNVHLPAPEKCAWTHDFIQECSAFPRGKYADRVDAMSQALVKWVMIAPRNPANEPTAEEAVATAAQPDDFGMGFDDSFFGDDELGELF